MYHHDFAKGMAIGFIAGTAVCIALAPVAYQNRRAVKGVARKAKRAVCHMSDCMPKYSK